MKNIYELGYWLKIDSNLNEDLERIKKILSSYEAEIIFEEQPKKRNLAYPIKKQILGYFGYLILKVEKEKIENIKKDLFKISNILRFIIIKRKYLQKQQQVTINELK